ncbi:sigma-70 family RNA polymerase sigma factor [Candidatus Daviesbacteria bacterium]|nr:sigma-70 family RNA polymerase sigma factor [Candidatus Daviesbacteria bacterium]
MRDLNSLVMQAKAGDAQSFGQIYDLFVDKVYKFNYFRVGSKEEAEDLTEQVFLKAFENLSTFQYQGAPFEAWLFRIARNNLIDYYRAHKFAIPLEEAGQLEDEQKSPEEIVSDNYTKQLVLESIRQPPDSYREIIILKYIEDRDNKEISIMLNKPEDHIRVLQSRALKALRKVVHL